MAAPAHKSATIMLVRESSEEGFQVFLLKRSMESTSLAGNYVYPGGMVERDDYDPKIRLLCNDTINAPHDQDHSALRVAGIRELYEEAGILLAVDQSGKTISLNNKNKVLKARFTKYRQSLLRKQISFQDIAEKENLIFETKALHYFAHWVTPEAIPLRFDAYFYCAQLPCDQEAIADQEETTDGLWISPDRALHNNLKGEIVLSPPTLKTLEDMARFNSVEELFSSCVHVDIPAVLSVYVRTGEYSFVVFPWDPEYENIAQGNLALPIIDHGTLTVPGEMTTRVLLKDGRSIPYRKKR